ncbi:hypothetical protein CDD83_9059 [Cordyceps sp. RAO-2017]|nr:hypothetical protein CDD83_9059 [Cordyceps sp. RAO-2017]
MLLFPSGAKKSAVALCLRKKKRRAVAPLRNHCPYPPLPLPDPQIPPIHPHPSPFPLHQTIHPFGAFAAAPASSPCRSLICALFSIFFASLFCPFRLVVRLVRLVLVFLHRRLARGASSPLVSSSFSGSPSLAALAPLAALPKPPFYNLASLVGPTSRYSAAPPAGRLCFFLRSICFEFPSRHAPADTRSSHFR